MGKATRRIQKRKKAIKILSDMMNQAENVTIIHYSCESFYDRPDGSSPRITSIAVRNLESGQTTSFSIHQMAERKKVTQQELEGEYDHLETTMLDEFYKYVQSHLPHKWLHWNMRDINYGFQAIAHRYRVLGGEPVEIPESNLVDLARIMTAIYGVGYISHPRLLKLVEKNKISKKDFLSGADEAIAFTNQDYVKLHQSTLRKVDIFGNITERADNNSLKTNSTWKDLYGSYPVAIGEFLKENWLIAIIEFLFAIIGFVTSIDWIF